MTTISEVNEARQRGGGGMSDRYSVSGSDTKTTYMDDLSLATERDAALAQVAALRTWINNECRPHARWVREGHNWCMSESDRERGRLLLADTAAAAEVHDERVRLAERQRIAEAVAELPSFDDAVERAAVLDIVGAE